MCSLLTTCQLGFLKYFIELDSYWPKGKHCSTFHKNSQSRSPGQKLSFPNSNIKIRLRKNTRRDRARSIKHLLTTVLIHSCTRRRKVPSSLAANNTITKRSSNERRRHLGLVCFSIRANIKLLYIRSESNMSTASVSVLSLHLMVSFLLAVERVQFSLWASF